MNIIDEIGILAISTRLQRLSEQLRKDGAQIYTYFNIDFEPKWFFMRKYKRKKIKGGVQSQGFDRTVHNNIKML